MSGDPLRAKYIADNFLSNVKQVNDKVIEERIPEISLDKGRAEEYKAGIFTGFKYKPDLEIEKLQQK
mgnify:CR=1 FL=1